MWIRQETQWQITDVSNKRVKVTVFWCKKPRENSCDARNKIVAVTVLRWKEKKKKRTRKKKKTWQWSANVPLRLHNDVIPYFRSELVNRPVSWLGTDYFDWVFHQENCNHQFGLFCVTCVVSCHLPLGVLSSTGGHWIFNMHNDPSTLLYSRTRARHGWDCTDVGKMKWSPTLPRPGVEAMLRNDSPTPKSNRVLIPSCMCL